MLRLGEGDLKMGYLNNGYKAGACAAVVKCRDGHIADIFGPGGFSMFARLTGKLYNLEAGSF